MKIKLQLITILAISVLIFPVMVLAESPPPMPLIPLLVYGNVTIDGQSASLDTEISAEIDNTKVAVATMIREGLYFIEIPDGRANEGKMIIFKVNGIVHGSQLKCANIDTTPSINFDLAIATTRSCSISNGQGIQTWDGSNWGDCIIESCNNGYHQEGNSCVADFATGGDGGEGSGGTSPSATIQGDINKDGKVDKYDFALMMANWGKTGSSASDLNDDNKVDKYDFAILMANWGI